MNVGDLVLVRHRFDRFSWLRVRIVGGDWFIGHRPATSVCHRAWLADVVRIERR